MGNQTLQQNIAMFPEGGILALWQCRVEDAPLCCIDLSVTEMEITAGLKSILYVAMKKRFHW